jgi:hypothetical protein
MKKIKEYIKSRGVLFASWFGITNPFGSDSFTTIDGAAAKISLALNTAIAASALVAVAVIIYGAYNMILSAGDSEMYEKGTKAIQAAIVGMIVVFLAKGIIDFLIQRNIVGIALQMYV